jgi:hypothetical protein
MRLCNLDSLIVADNQFNGNLGWPLLSCARPQLSRASWAAAPHQKMGMPGQVRRSSHFDAVLAARCAWGIFLWPCCQLTLIESLPDSRGNIVVLRKFLSVAFPCHVLGCFPHEPARPREDVRTVPYHRSRDRSKDARRMDHRAARGASAED